MQCRNVSFSWFCWLIRSIYFIKGCLVFSCGCVCIVQCIIETFITKSQNEIAMKCNKCTLNTRILQLKKVKNIRYHPYLPSGVVCLSYHPFSSSYFVCILFLFIVYFAALRWNKIRLNRQSLTHTIYICMYKFWSTCSELLSQKVNILIALFLNRL
jgi:hypothetical protein